jgi:transcriptional regulator with XRE-family HTH domain
MSDENGDENGIAAIVKKARQAKGWSQPELARRANTTQQTVWKLESGKQKFSSHLPAIALALGISLEQVMGCKGDAPSDDEAPHGVSDAYLRAAEGMLASALDMVRKAINAK